MTKSSEPFIITNHHELRKRITLDCSSPLLTDQSYKHACDINVIMDNYAKTGMLSHVNNKQPQFLDNSDIPSLETAFNIVNLASEAFFDLPPAIRKLMDNNPSKLESFIQDPENHELLVKHGLLLKKESAPTETPVTAITPKQEVTNV